MRRFAFLALLAAFLALPAVATDVQSVHYQHVGRPPVAGEFFGGFDFAYMDEISPAVSLGWQHKATGIMVEGGITALHIDPIKGEAPLTVGCKDFLVPYTTGNHTRAVYQIGVRFPLRKLAAHAP